MRLLPVSKALAILGATTAITALSITNAQASPIEFDYTFNPTDVLMNNTGNVCTGNTAANTVSSTDCVSLQFSFTLIGYAAATDTLASGSLELVFYDDNTPGPDTSGTHQERVNISLDGALTSNSPLLISTGSTSASPFSTSFDVLAQLQDGALTVLLTPSALTGNNDFFFASSRSS